MSIGVSHRRIAGSKSIHRGGMEMRTISRDVGPPEQSISRRLRDIIPSRGLTAYAVGKSAGVDPGVVQRFLNGERGLSLATVDKLAAALNLRLIEVPGGEGSPPGSGPVRI